MKFPFHWCQRSILLAWLCYPPAVSAEYFYVSKAGVTLWGTTTFDSPLKAIPDGIESALAIDAGDYHAMALKADGSVVVWGSNEWAQCNVPGTARNIVAIAAGGDQCLALKADGTLVRWGYNGYNLHPIPAGIGDVVAISAAYSHCLALRSDRTVFAWGGRISGGELPWIDVPETLRGATAISAGRRHSVALFSDLASQQTGILADWGFRHDLWGVESQPTPVNCVAIAAKFDFTLALMADGTVRTGGNNLTNRKLVPPAGLSGVNAIATTNRGGLALKADGKVVWWGNEWGDGSNPVHFTPIADGVSQLNASNPVSVIQMAGGYDYAMALVKPPLPDAGFAAVNRAWSMVIPSRVALPRFTAMGLPPGLTIHATTGVISGTPQMAGSWNTTVTMANRAYTINTPLRLVIEPSGYAAWREAFWSMASAESAVEGDPDGDGRPNGVEYALGSSPLSADASVIQNTGLDPDNRLVLTVDVPVSRVGLVQWTAGFGSTLPITAPLIATGEEAPPGEALVGFRRYRFTDPMKAGDNPSRFACLRATLQ